MKSISVVSMTDAMDSVERNPYEMQRRMYDLLTEAHEGTREVVDPTNPFSALLEMSAVLSANAISKFESINRKNTPKLTRTAEELYGHVPSAYYSDVFSQPSNGALSLVFSVEEIVSNALPVDGESYERIIIPRDSSFTVSNTTFLIEYPLEIRVLSNGSINVIYDTTDPSPLLSVEGNIAEINYITNQGLKLISIDVPVIQAIKTRVEIPASSLTGVEYVMSLTDQYCYCRAYHKVNGEWVEIEVSHANESYDNNTTTVVLQVVDDQLTARVPIIYSNSSMLGSDVRLDVYTTKGALEMALTEYANTSFTFTWLDSDPDDNAKYSEVMNSLSYAAVVGLTDTYGGRDALEFTELRDRVVNGSLTTDVPVTEDQLTNVIEDMEFEVSRSEDNVTDRRFIATRSLPVPSSSTLSSSVDVAVEPVKLLKSELRELSSVNEHDDRISILPDTLWKREDNSVVLVSDLERELMEAMEGEVLVNNYPTTEYLNTPFLTILDTEDNSFEYRSYQIDQPVLNHRYFKGSNSNTEYEASMDTIQVSKVESGYYILITVTMDDSLMAVDAENRGVQLAFKPEEMVNYVYLEGVYQTTLDDGRAVYAFNLESTFDVDASNRLIVNNFQMVRNDTLKYQIETAQSFELIHYVENLGNPETDRGELEDYFGREFVESDAIAITHEQLELTLFTPLYNVFTRNRTSIADKQYQLWTVDVPKTYTETVFQRDGNGFIEFDEETGDPIILHNVGDPCLVDGEQVYKARIGDYRRDVKGERIPVTEDELNYYIDIILFDARFSFITDTTQHSYFTEVANTIVGWSNTDIADISDNMISRTTLGFAPKGTVGTVEVSSIVGESITIDASMSVEIDLYMTANGYADQELRASIEASCKSVVVANLAKTEVSTETMQIELRDVVGDEVTTIKVQPLAGDNQLDAFIVSNDVAGCSLAKTLQLNSDGTTSLVDDLQINWYRHKS